MVPHNFKILERMWCQLYKKNHKISIYLDSEIHPKQKEQCRGITIPNFKAYSKAIVIKALILHKTRSVVQWKK